MKLGVLPGWDCPPVPLGLLNVSPFPNRAPLRRGIFCASPPEGDTAISWIQILVVALLLAVGLVSAVLINSN